MPECIGFRENQGFAQRVSGARHIHADGVIGGRYVCLVKLVCFRVPLKIKFATLRNGRVSGRIIQRLAGGCRERPD